MPKCPPFIVYAYFALFALTLLAFISVDISPDDIVIAGFLSFLVPGVIILNFIVLVLFMMKRSLLALLPLYILLLGYEHIQATFAVNAKDGTGEAGEQFEVLSYNAQFFNAAGNDKSTAAKDWIMNNGADIMCFQEFSNDARSENLDIIQTLSKNDAYDFVFSTVRKKIDRRQSGVIIFSKFPIVKKGALLFSENRYNKGCFADIKMENDTVRIINVHLQSMQLNEESGYGNVPISFLRKLKHGLVERSIQATELIRFIDKSPYKVIICGDFNATPYSYVYRLFEKQLNNAFEKAGSGFGISYPGKFLFFLRIDHQFYDPRIEILDFSTLDNVRFSDHYPVTGTYRL